MGLGLFGPVPPGPRTILLTLDLVALGYLSLRLAQFAVVVGQRRHAPFRAPETHTVRFGPWCRRLESGGVREVPFTESTRSACSGPGALADLLGRQTPSMGSHLSVRRDRGPLPHPWRSSVALRTDAGRFPLPVGHGGRGMGVLRHAARLDRDRLVEVAPPCTDRQFGRAVRIGRRRVARFRLHL